MSGHTTIPALVDSLAQIPEYRAARGKQHPLLALLLLIGVAMLCGARSQSAIADWGRHHGRGWLGRLGFTAGRAPSQPTLSRLFQRISHRTVEAVLGRSAFSHRAGVVLGQTAVADRANEIGAAQDFLLALMLDGRVVTADALLTQPELTRTPTVDEGDERLGEAVDGEGDVGEV